MKPSLRDPLDRIRYINLAPDAERRIGDFVVRADVPLPVEIEPEADPGLLARNGLSWEAIISAMLKILAYRPGHPDAPYFREFVLAVRPEIDAELTQAAVAKSRARGFEVAIEAFRALEGLDPGTARHAVNLALVYEERAHHARQGGREVEADADLELALAAYRRALAVDEAGADTRWYLASFHLRQQNYDRAHAELEAFIAASPPDHVRLDEAKAALREIDSRNLMDDLFRSAYDYIRMGQEQKGIARITEFLAANPGVWNGWFLLGWANRRLRKYAEARSAFTRALELGGRNIDLLNELAICAMELGDLRAARSHLEQALGMDTENVKVLSNLAVLSLREGKPKDAEAYFRLVLDIDPEDPVARSSMESLTD